MKVVIAYESMFGNTHQIADAIASGFRPEHDVRVTRIDGVDPDAPRADVLIIGVPTHAHGLPRQSSRQGAIDSAHTKYEDHPLEPTAGEPGVREWLQRLPSHIALSAAAFDTRFRPPAWLVGHPANRITRTLRQHGATIVAPPTSFFVDKHEQLVPGELDRARAWGESICRKAEDQHLARR